MLPLFLARKINQDLAKAFSKFIWHGRKPKQRVKILQLPTHMGGLSMPNLVFYNWVCHAAMYSSGYLHILRARLVLTPGLVLQVPNGFWSIAMKIIKAQSCYIQQYAMAAAKNHLFRQTFG